MMSEMDIQKRLDMLRKEYLNNKISFVLKKELYTRITELQGILNCEGEKNEAETKTLDKIFEEDEDGVDEDILYQYHAGV